MKDINTAITIETTVNAPSEHVWKCWTDDNHITQWNFAADTWCCPWSKNDLRIGGTFTFRMEAKDGSFGFDFGGVYSDIIPQSLIAYGLEDGRQVKVTFEKTEGGIKVTETFDIENMNPAEMQRAGWQAILDNFRKHAESSYAS